MTTEAPQAPSTDPNRDGLPVPVDQRIVAIYEDMLSTVPDAGGNGADGILDLIAAATDIAGLDAPWRAGSLAALNGVPLMITGIRKAESDFDTGLAWFLLVDAVDQSTGEMLTITTGAISVVAQLVKAHALGAFPLRVIPRVAARPSANGFYPQHLEIRR